MRKQNLWISMLCLGLMIATGTTRLYANSEFEGSEEEWLNKCSVAQSSQEDAQKCQEFKEYYNQKSSSLEDEISNMQKKQSELAADLSNLRDLIEEMDETIKDIDDRIAFAEETVATMRTNIIALDSQMQEKQEEIAKLDEQIKRRMQSEQASIGTNRYVDVIMGAKDVVELIRLLQGIGIITENDQAQMDEAMQARADLKLQQEEQERLKADMEDQIQENEKLKEVQIAGKEEQEKLYAKHYQQQLAVMAQMETAKADISSMQGAIAGINTNVRDDIFETPSQNEPTETPETPDNEPSPEPGTPDGGEEGGSEEPTPTPGNTAMIKPIGYDWYCGTWYYPDGKTPHLGADYSGPSGAPVVAPARSLVLYANDPYGSTQYGSTLGWPYGGGNTIHLLTQVNGTTYGISFFHLSKGILVSPGQLVEQGQTVAYSGSSGNSTGPHLHVEVINLGTMSVTEAQARFAQTADFAWGSGWSLSSTCSNRSAPCREQPENFFGY